MQAHFERWAGPRFRAIETQHTYMSNRYGEIQTSYQNLSHEVTQVHQYATNLNQRMDQWEQSSASHLASLRELDVRAESRLAREEAMWQQYWGGSSTSGPEVPPQE